MQPTQSPFCAPLEFLAWQYRHRTTCAVVIFIFNTAISKCKNLRQVWIFCYAQKSVTRSSHKVLVWMPWRAFLSADHSNLCYRVGAENGLYPCVCSNLPSLDKTSSLTVRHVHDLYIVVMCCAHAPSTPEYQVLQQLHCTHNFCCDFSVSKLPKCNQEVCHVVSACADKRPI